MHRGTQPVSSGCRWLIRVTVGVTAGLLTKYVTKYKHIFQWKIKGGSMKKVSTINEALANGFPKEPMHAIANTLVDYLDGNDAGNADLAYQLGGELRLCETLEDVGSIEHVDGLLKDSPGVFDVLIHHTEEKFFEVVLCTNNAGGDCYFIPDELAITCPNFVESIGINKV